MRVKSWGLLCIFLAAACSSGETPEKSGKVSQASHGDVSLAGSNFEIDTDANLKVDHTEAGVSIDWGSVAHPNGPERRQTDTESGSGDNSFVQGTKEDTAIPVIESGGIPPNKSDLKHFGVYLEENAAGKFLHLFWHRVQDPSGTTNMDFEFNQSKTLTSNGVTPVRTAGDLLIQYDLAKGGTSPKLYVSRWVTSGACEAANSAPCWGPKQDFTALTSDAGVPLATGSINTSTIVAGDSDGLGDVSPRTFGEASINFSALVPADTCTSFGSAYLKSRSSDSFTSALKDFIPPKDVDINNCGSIKIVKKDDAGTLLNGAVFTLYKNNAPLAGPRGAEDTIITSKSCTTGSDASKPGECVIGSVLAGNYWVVETTTPANHDTAADQAAVVPVDSTITLEFIDTRHRGAIKITKQRKHAADDAGLGAHSGVTFNIDGVDIPGATDVNGVLCIDNLLFGTYSISEDVPTGYSGESAKSVTVDNRASCAGTAYVGETVTFTNTPKSNITVSFTSQIPGGTKAKINCGALTPATADSTPDAFDDTSESYENLLPGTYTCTVVIDP